MPDSSGINLLVSLDREATAIIGHFRLKRDAGRQVWPLYHNDNVSLVVSGMGKTNAAAACAWLQAQRPASCWINIGIAGHATADIGSSWLVHKITDKDSNENWYPQTTLLPDLASRPLTCVSSAADYESETDLYDMESAGFINAAAHFTTLEWIQLIKIVSDNRHEHWQKLDKNRVPELVSQSLPMLEKVIDTLATTFIHTHPESHDEALRSRLETSLHFSATQRNELATLLGRCHALGCSPSADELLQQQNARQLLKLLTENIRRTALDYELPRNG